MNLEYYVNCVEQGLSSLNKLLEANSDHIAYNSDSSIVVVRRDIKGIPLYIKKGAWKLDEVKDFKTFADNLQILYADNSSRLNAVSVKCKELYNHPDYDIYNNICGKISQGLIPNRDNTYATAVELINIWDKLATSLAQIKETDAKQQTLFSSKEAKFYSEDRAVLLYPHGNITKELCKNNL